ncbi:hypothetical protein [Billgrantia bachuensis]|uniref:Uncharacterized protein n=1 Tax=Billgrantia bachuensis TaxID=2717286 RepID=A0ABX0PQX6_9GAMM|nr:hypothetical protein [Halomonas bachuensis]NIC03984.1 hypothetical protein [Halomonas bachuensis]
MPSSHVEAFATPGITPPAAFDRLRADLHDAAGPDRLAELRTVRAVHGLRDRAAEFVEQMNHIRGAEYRAWYAEVAARLGQFADELEADAKANGITQ